MLPGKVKRVCRGFVHDFVPERWGVQATSGEAPRPNRRLGGQHRGASSEPFDDAEAGAHDQRVVVDRAPAAGRATAVISSLVKKGDVRVAPLRDTSRIPRPRRSRTERSTSPRRFTRPRSSRSPPRHARPSRSTTSRYTDLLDRLALPPVLLEQARGRGLHPPGSPPPAGRAAVRESRTLPWAARPRAPCYVASARVRADRAGAVPGRRRLRWPCRRGRRSTAALSSSWLPARR